MLCDSRFYALLAALLCIIRYLFEGFKKIKERNAAEGKRSFPGYACLVEAIISLFVLWLLPQLYFKYLNGNTVDDDYLYLKGLPELMMEKFDLYLWYPVIAGTAMVIIFGFVSGLEFRNMVRSRLSAWIGIIGCVVMAVWCLKAERKSEQLRATVLMLEHIDKREWRKVVNIMSLIHEPANYTMLKLNNVALSHLGVEGRNVESMKPVNIDARHSESFSATAFVNVPVFYFTGSPNQSYRWAMEHSVQYGKRVFYLKYMIKDALVNGEIELAKRYNDILMSTLFHRKWAKEINRFIEDPSLIQSDEEFSGILKLMD